MCADKLLARIRGDHSSHGIFAKAKGFQGLLLALKTRIDEVMDERKKLLKKIKVCEPWPIHLPCFVWSPDLSTCAVQALSEKPSDKEVAESGNCQRCRQDWKKQGPMCKNCHLSDEIEAYDKMLFTYTKQSLNHMAEEEEEDEAAQPGRCPLPRPPSLPSPCPKPSSRPRSLLQRAGVATGLRRWVGRRAISASTRPCSRSGRRRRPFGCSTPRS